MNDYLILNEEERLKWLNYILDMCKYIDFSCNMYIAGYFIIQLYEFMVACSERKVNEPVKLKQLQAYYDTQQDIKTAIVKLYRLRCVLTHNPCDKQVIDYVSSFVVSRLEMPIRKFFGDVNYDLIINTLVTSLKSLGNVGMEHSSCNDLMGELRNMCK